MYTTLIFGSWLFSTGIGLYWLIKKRELSDTARAVWTFFMIVVPYLGPLIFMIATLNNRKPKIP